MTTFRRHIRSGPVEEKNERFPNEQIRTEFITKHTDQRVSIDCKIITIYKCLEDGDIDMNGEDDNSDTGFTAEESDRDDDMVWIASSLNVYVARHWNKGSAVPQTQPDGGS